MSKPWLRLYTNIIDNHKMLMLAFEDRRHYVALLALKGSGLLDSSIDPIKLHRKLSIKLGVSIQNLDEIKRRLIEEELIDNNFQPKGWPDKQFESDSSKERVRKHRAKNKSSNNQKLNSEKQPCNVTVTLQDTDTDKDKERTRTTVDKFQFKFEHYWDRRISLTNNQKKKIMASFKFLNLPKEASQRVIDEATGQALTGNVKNLAELIIKLAQLAKNDQCKFSHYSQSISESRQRTRQNLNLINQQLSGINKL